MSYIVLARKWRPVSFDDVIGQSHITDTLKKAIEKNRIAHAYIFSGTRGVGKTTTARILARALNCEKGPTPVPCGKCDACKGIGGGSSFDVLEIDGASNNSVDDIRELRENVGYSSMGGKYRIYVIDEVHMLSKPAFNALLKTLEEPPQNVIFIFATTEPDKIPATIISRCQRYDFRRIIPEQIRERLAFICRNEGLEAEPNALALIATKADGSMRDALSLLDQVFSCSQGKLTEQETRLVLGLVRTEIFAKIMDAVAEKTPAPVLETVQQVLYEGFDLHEFVTGLETHLREMLFARICPGGKQTGNGQRQPERFSDGDLLRMIEIIRKAENELKWSAHPRIAVEMMLLKLVFLDRTIAVDAMLSALGGSDADAGREKVSVPPAAASADAKQEKAGKIKETGDRGFPVASASGEAVSLEQEEEGASVSGNGETAGEGFNDNARKDPEGWTAARWREFIDKVMRDRPHIGTFLALAAVAGSSDSSVDLVFRHDFSFQFGEISRKQHREEIVSMLSDFMGRPMEIRMTLEPKSTMKSEPDAGRPAAVAASIESEKKKEPVIGTVLDMFDGEVLA